jgi:hypothetical protein
MRMRDRARRWRELVWVAAVVVVALGVLAAFASAGWPGQANGCIARGTCFCEAFRGGWVRQPANTWSNLGFVAVGLAIALQPGRMRGRMRVERAAAPPANPMTTGSFIPGLYATVVALLGPGSMALHASMTAEGGRWDVLSMYVWVSFCIAYGAMRAVGFGRGVFAALYAVLVAALAANLWGSFRLNSDVLFGVLIGSFAVAEGVVWWRRRELHQERRWLLAAGASFGLAFAIWLPSRRLDGALCDPDSLVQGHAAWHLLSALSTLFIYLYYRSERAAA